MEPVWLKMFIEKLIRESVATPETIVGCTEHEIGEIQQSQKTLLPPCYRSFLQVMGRCAGEFWVGSDVYYPVMLDNKEAAEELLTENESKLRLPPDAIVFWMHQGYQFAFILAEKNECLVYYYNECTEPEPDNFVCSGTFEKVLNTELDGHIRIKRDIDARRKGKL